MPRATLRAAAGSRVASGVGRIWSRSAAIGFSSRNASGAAPNSAARSRAVNEKVTHSSIPRLASVRRAVAARTWRGVRVASGTGAIAGSDTGGTVSSPRRRSTSSTRSASGSISRRPAAAARANSGSSDGACSNPPVAATSLRQGGTATVTRSAARWRTVKPSRSRDSTASKGGTARPPSVSSRSNRSVASRRQSGSAPASATSLGSPPHRAMTMAVAASSAAGSSEGSMPRSNRLRASEAIAWRRPVSATATGSNRAHSMNTLVVSAVLPVASPPITPAMDCTPAASAMAQSSSVRV